MSNDYLTKEDRAIIENIYALEDYRKMQAGWFPPTVRSAKSDKANKYFFISYSHSDFKRVFEDLFKLIRAAEHIQEENDSLPFFIVYDKELLAGRDWETTAGTLITNNNCNGVIFYISEKSLNSNAIHKEIEYVKKSGKPFLSINFPIETIDGQKGNYFSAQEMFRILYKENKLTSVENLDEKRLVFNDVFNEKVIYLTDLEDDIKRVQTIVNSLVGVPVLNFTNTTRKIHPVQRDLKKLVVSSINDNNIVEINTTDFNCEHQDIEASVSIIGSCAFANCRYLEKIDLPDTIYDIEANAFFNCSSLKTINLGNVTTISDYAFCGCSSLKETGMNFFSSLWIIGAGAFSDCLSLDNIEIPDCVGTIGTGAFERSGIKKVVFSENSKICVLEDRVFKDCTRLEQIKFPPRILFDYVRGNKDFILGDLLFANCVSLKDIVLPYGVSKLGNYVFYGCDNLKEITIPIGVMEIGDYCFLYCENLSDLFYNGTYKEWKKIKVGKGLFDEDIKKSLLNEQVKAFKMKGRVACSIDLKNIKEVKLHCTDVTITLYIDFNIYFLPRIDGED